MGDVRRAQSSTCSPRLCWDIQFPVCQWQDVPCISSKEITTHSLCEDRIRTQIPKYTFKILAFNCLSLMFPNLSFKAEKCTVLQTDRVGLSPHILIHQLWLWRVLGLHMKVCNFNEFVETISEKMNSSCIHFQNRWASTFQLCGENSEIHYLHCIVLFQCIRTVDCRNKAVWASFQPELSDTLWGGKIIFLRVNSWC